MATLNSPTLGKHSVDIDGLEIDPGEVELGVADLTDSTAIGVDLVTAASAADARTAIGAGTSNLALGTTAGTALEGNYVPELGAGDLTDATAIGVDLITAADAGAARTAIGAGTSSLVLGSGGTQAAAGNHVHAASTVSTTAIATITGTDVQAVLAEIVGRLVELEPNG